MNLAVSAQLRWPSGKQTVNTDHLRELPLCPVKHRIFVTPAPAQGHSWYA